MPPTISEEYAERYKNLALEKRVAFLGRRDRAHDLARSSTGRRVVNALEAGEHGDSGALARAYRGQRPLPITT